MGQAQSKGWPDGAARAVILAAATLCLAAAGHAAEVRVDITGLRNETGTVRVAICKREGFTHRTCRYTASAPATRQSMVVPGVEPGRYAVQAHHDENGNGEIDRRSFRRPVEGLGFSRDAPMRFGPPRFSDAAVLVPEHGGRVSLTMRYFDE